MTQKTTTLWPRTIGGRVKYLLEARDKTQVQLADACGVTQAAISNIVSGKERSRKPSAPTLLKMAAALNASANWIITGEGQPFEVVTVSRDAEKRLLQLFRQLDDSQQKALIATAQAMVK